MNDKNERRTIVKVTDEKAEGRLNYLGISITIIISLISGMGYMVIDGQKDLNNAIQQTNKALNKFTSLLHSIVPQVSQNKEDIERLNNRVFFAKQGDETWRANQK